MANLADFLVRLSGGAANTSAAAAIGGAMSTAPGGRVLSQTYTDPNITGVTVDDAMGNNVGSGTLAFVNSATTLRWTPPGGTAGTAVTVSSDGVYAIQGGSNGGVLLVTIVSASLPGSDTSKAVTIANQLNKVFDDVTKAESRDGVTAYRGLFCDNAHASESMVDIKIWVESNTPGADVIQIAINDEGQSMAIETLADENTAPNSIDFDASSPVDYSSGLALTDMAFDDYEGFWLKRTVPADTNDPQASNTFRLGFRIYV